MSRFSEVDFASPVEVFALREAYERDPAENKIDLGFGTYRDDDNHPYVLPVVRQVEKILASDATLHKEALPVLGLRSFTNASAKLLFGIDSPALLENRTCSAQVVSVTGGMYVAASFLSKIMGYDTYYHSIPIPYNHCKLVFESAGFKYEKVYGYWSQEHRMLDMKSILDDLRAACPNAVVFLQLCAHNPTGTDPNKEEWKAIADVMQEKQLFPFIDCSNIGLASGNLEQDAWALRYLVKRGFELVAVLSFAKNFGLYNERIGNLTFVVKDNRYVPHIESQLISIIRGIYDSPPDHGARIVAYILTDQQLFNEWKFFLYMIHKHIVEMRKDLRDALERATTPGTWSHITSQVGMFTYTGLDETEALNLTQNHHIYLLRCGRINMCGVNYHNVDAIAEAICRTVTRQSQPPSVRLYDQNSFI